MEKHKPSDQPQSPTHESPDATGKTLLADAAPKNSSHNKDVAKGLRPDTAHLHKIPTIHAGADVDQSQVRAENIRTTNAAVKATPDDKAPIIAVPAKEDINKRNALVLDYYLGNDNGSIAGQPNKSNPTHGDFIAQSLTQEGFNVTKAQNLSTYKLSLTDFSQSFNDINKKIESGKLHLGQGDVITASFGQAVQTVTVDGKIHELSETGDPKFSEASKHLKLDITADNLQSQIPQIKERLKLVADGRDPQTGEPSTSIDTDDVEFQKKAQAATRTNEAIDKLQAKGISVIHAAGNSGADHFAMDFLSAKYDLSSNSPDGKLENFSASNSHTTKANGFYPIELKSSPSLLDPALTTKPVTTELQVGDKNIFFSSEGASTQELSIDKSKLTTKSFGSPGAIGPTQPTIEQTLFNPNKTSDAPHMVPFHQALTNPDTTKFAGSLGANFFVADAKIRSGAKPNVVGFSAGTSFSVIDLLDGKSDRKVPLPEPR